MSDLICNKIVRREKVRQHKQLNGLDYLEVGQIEQSELSLESQRELTVYFLGKAPVELDDKNIRIEGGQRIRDIQVTSVEIHKNESVEFDDYMTVIVDRPGDFSTYVLSVVEKNEQGEWQTHSQFDPRYDHVEFNFKVDCPNELDCKQDAFCPPEKKIEPDINYLAKDYASFRQLILDRLALVMPDWKERHVPDIGIALVEVLAYVGDHLSYFQDAVATEAYLDTARKRISVRRHARLVDYSMHEGCNARAWLCIQTDNDLPSPIKPEEVYFITGFNEVLQTSGTVLKLEELQKYPRSQYEVFEPMGDEEIHLYKDHNKIKIYTWNDQECCLPTGSTSATLIGEWISPESSDEESKCDPEDEPETPIEEDPILLLEVETPEISLGKLYLNIGDVLIFEEVMGPETGHPQDANPTHRHAVRIQTIEPYIDPLNGQHVVNITWDTEDALPFPLCLSALGPAPDCMMLRDVSIACGNVILVDHGQTIEEGLGEVPEKESIECCKGEGVLADSVFIPGLYNPELQKLPLTHCEPLDNNKPASQTLIQDVRSSIPKININSKTENNELLEWESKRDLLSSRYNDLHFVAELDNDGRAHLRFGNGEMGKRPEAGMSFQANYRVGNGLAGNVGAEAISHLVFRGASLSGVNINLRNPMPAQGGTASEPVTEAKLFAPQSFRKELQRAIIAEDYAAIVLREFKGKVQNAVGRLRWNGSGYEVLVAVDPFGKEEADQKLLDQISQRLYRYRRMGHDLVVRSARRVPLDIELNICVLPNYLRGHVKAELLKVFSNKKMSDGKLGFFHPDKLTFGDDIYLSKLIAIAQSVQGIEKVTVTKMQRWCELPNNEIENGILPLAPFEIAHLDNDPGSPENGKFNLAMGGGR